MATTEASNENFLGRRSGNLGIFVDKTILWVEGPTDVLFWNGILEESWGEEQKPVKVESPNSEMGKYRGKKGVLRILKESLSADNRFKPLAVVDRDFDLIPPEDPPLGLYYYDLTDRETMMIRSVEVFEKVLRNRVDQTRRDSIRDLCGQAIAAAALLGDLRRRILKERMVQRPSLPEKLEEYFKEPLEDLILDREKLLDGMNCNLSREDKGHWQTICTEFRKLKQPEGNLEDLAGCRGHDLLKVIGIALRSEWVHEDERKHHRCMSIKKLAYDLGRDLRNAYTLAHFRKTGLFHDLESFPERHGERLFRSTRP